MKESARYWENGQWGVHPRFYTGSVFDEIENACEAEPLSEFLAYELTHRGGQADNPLRIRVMCIKASVSSPTQPPIFNKSIKWI